MNPASILTVSPRILPLLLLQKLVHLVSRLRHTTDGVPNDSINPPLSISPFDKEEPKEKDSTYVVDLSSPKDSSSPSFVERVHKPLPPFPHRLKKKNQAHVNKM